MRPIQVKLDLDSPDEENTKVTVCYHEGDTAERLGFAAEIVVYVDRRGLQSSELSDEGVQRAEQFLRRIVG